MKCGFLQWWHAQGGCLPANLLIFELFSVYTLGDLQDTLRNSEKSIWVCTLPVFILVLVHALCAGGGNKAFIPNSIADCPGSPTLIWSTYSMAKKVSEMFCNSWGGSSSCFGVNYLSPFLPCSQIQPGRIQRGLDCNWYVLVDGIFIGSGLFLKHDFYQCQSVWHISPPELLLKTMGLGLRQILLTQKTE